MRDDREKLKDILEAIEQIEKYVARGKKAFEQDELIQTWILHHFLILGEAAAQLSDVFQEKHPQIQWNKIIGMRNILIHRYFGVDKDIVWSVVENDLPKLKSDIQSII